MRLVAQKGFQNEVSSIFKHRRPGAQKRPHGGEKWGVSHLGPTRGGKVRLHVKKNTCVVGAAHGAPLAESGPPLGDEMGTG